ncbi:hypothetical protein [Streptomyces sp. NPDC003832]
MLLALLFGVAMNPPMPHDQETLPTLSEIPETVDIILRGLTPRL